jgi:hypothetical protein
MTPIEQQYFVEAYANNVAEAPYAFVVDFVKRYEAGEDMPYGEHYTSIMDALGVWHSAKLFYKLYFKAEEKENG